MSLDVTTLALAKSYTNQHGGSGGSIPKPLTYDYMPEGYPKKSVQTATLLEEHEFKFSLSGDGAYKLRIPGGFTIAKGQIYTVNWDGTEYECVGSTLNSMPVLGNLSIAGAGDDTGEPFFYVYNESQSLGQFSTLDTSARHTISVKTTVEVITPMAYDYMPEGYPTKSVQTTTLMEEQQVAFTSVGSKGLYAAELTNAFEIVDGQTYTVNWDGTEYECVGFVFHSTPSLGNLSIMGAGDDTGEPFIYVYDIEQAGGMFGTLDTSASHTISVKTTVKTVTPMEEEFLPSTVTAVIENAATKESPVFTGSFSQNRKNNTTVGNYSFAEGYNTTASKSYSHAEGYNTTASGSSSHAEGYETTASGDESHTEGFRTTASGDVSHAEGSNCTASGEFSHVEGVNCTASGQFSHAEGSNCTASGQASHAEGYGCKASGQYSHAEGYHCTAQGKNQRVQGKFNIVSGTSDSIVDSDYSHIVGNGASYEAPSNAHTLTWSGDAWYAGDVYVGSTSGTNRDEGSKKLATEEYVDSKQVQSDWNQNDSTAADYVKNRPFYAKDPVETVLVEESTVSFADGGGVYYAEFPSTFSATVGDTYAVKWDGTEYECVCSAFNSVPVLGNPAIAGAGSDTGEPFVMRVSNGKGLQIFTLDTSATHTFSISGFVAQNVQIPDKYISDTFRDVIIAGDPLDWSTADWTKYYGLFQGGKLLKINTINSTFEGYVLSMFYGGSVSLSQISVITSDRGFYTLATNSTTNELYWSPIFQLDKLYLMYLRTGSDPSEYNQEEYNRLETKSNALTFTTKKASENPVERKVVLEGDKELILSSSTTSSTKKFKITVDDSGTLKATEVTST